MFDLRDEDEGLLEERSGTGTIGVELGLGSSGVGGEARLMLGAVLPPGV